MYGRSCTTSVVQVKFFLTISLKKTTKQQQQTTVNNSRQHPSNRITYIKLWMKYTAKFTQTLVFSTCSCPRVSQMAFLYSCTCNFIVGQAKLYPHAAKPLITLGFQWNRWEWGALDLFQVNIARDFVALAKLWGGHTPQQQQKQTNTPPNFPGAGEMPCMFPWGNQNPCPAVWRYQGRKQDLC